VEADWAAEIGPGLDWIDADWPGFVDLRLHPEAIHTIPEAAANLSLREVLASLNAADSPVFTSKCDVWALTAEDIDPLEFDCSPDEAKTGTACWVDVIAVDRELFESFKRHEGWVRRVAERLRALPGSCGRADLVVRAAVCGGREGFGVTVYAAGCGADTPAAQLVLGQGLRAAATVTMEEAAPLHPSPRASSSIG
jgi:hypothetical protein